MLKLNPQGLLMPSQNIKSSKEEMYHQFVMVISSEKRIDLFENYGLDGYIVRAYPVGHKSYSLYMGDKSYWMNHFTKTKINRRGNKYPKGFLEIGTGFYNEENE
ncbi:hypothetical protein [Aquiflexum lacus]|uniref:hypothetical protein n=1 Tax=Aquiflexum lacus TaxID=2483805 RepID=UPI001895F251|nr:hypothetical protein [Aquiflexum lacus]